MSRGSRIQKTEGNVQKAVQEEIKALEDEIKYLNELSLRVMRTIQEHRDYFNRNNPKTALASVFAALENFKNACTDLEKHSNKELRKQARELATRIEGVESFIENGRYTNAKECLQSYRVNVLLPFQQAIAKNLRQIDSSIISFGSELDKNAP